MFELILKLLGTGLSIWEHKEKNKYADEMLQLKRDWYEEFNKGAGKRSNAVLDNIERELRLLAERFVAAAGAKNP